VVLDMAGGDSILAIIIIVAGVSGLALFILQPLLQKGGSKGLLEEYYQETPLHELLSRKDNLYQGIKDLEFDYRSAKLSEEDYQSLRDKLEQEAMEVLEEIDNIDKRSKNKGKKRKKNSPGSPLQSISKPAAGKKKGKKSGNKKKNKFCTECGQPYENSTKFCTGCGNKLSG